MPELIGWLKKNDQEQLEWAFQYLRKRIPLPYSIESTRYEDLIQLDKNNHSDPHYILTLRSMKSAWRQKKSREKRKGKTEFSLVISNDKKRKLKALANQKGKTLGETLEDLIEHESIKSKEHKEEIAEEKKQLRQKLELTRESHKRKIYEIEISTSTLMYLLEEYLIKMIQCELDALKVNQPADHPDIEANEYRESRFSTEIEVINRSLKKTPSWNPKSFPLDIVEKLNMKALLNEQKSEKSNLRLSE